jgi:hypothetical protein
MGTGWNLWKLTTLGLALVMATALVAGLVVANWSGLDSEHGRFAPAATRQALPPRIARPASQIVHGTPTTPVVPTRDVVEACNRQAAAQVADHDKTQEVVTDAGIGAVVGAAGGAVAGGGKGAAIGVGGGTLYGLNENRKNDEKYRAVYSRCMRARGFTAG